MSTNDKLADALRVLLDLVERETCRHEVTHRGGSIWTICDDCGMKWADDRDDFVPYVDAVAQAREALAAHAASLAAPPAQGEFLPADEQPPFTGIAGCRPLERAPQPAPASVQVDEHDLVDPAIWPKQVAEIESWPKIDESKFHDIDTDAQPPAPAPVQAACRCLECGAEAGEPCAEECTHPPAPTADDAENHVFHLTNIRDQVSQDGLDDSDYQVGAIDAAIAALQQAQQPGAQAVAIEPEPDLDAHDPKSGELVAQWLFRNGFRELAAVVRAQLDMRAPRKAPPPLPEGVSEEDVEAAARGICARNGWDPDRTSGVTRRAQWRAYESDARAALESYRARLAAKAGGDRAG